MKSNYARIGLAKLCGWFGVTRQAYYQNNWEGTNDGKPIPDGTYYYVITYDLVSGKTFQTKGDVTILR